jgi:phosphonate metabolism protein PhnN/1,5-bisphosphokinase (PRPP-forming)
MSRRGVLFLVVGPSGVGKDLIITGARQLLDNDSSFHFPVRWITRPADAGGEIHRAATLEEFEAVERAGGFMLSWRAHGHAYGVPAAAEAALDQGRSVIVNVSRAVIDLARRRWAPLRIMKIAAPRELLRARLLARGRETVDVVEQRLDRADAYELSGDDIRSVVNSDTPDRVIARFVALLEHEVLSSIASQKRESLGSG